MEYTITMISVNNLSGEWLTKVSETKEDYLNYFQACLAASLFNVLLTSKQVDSFQVQPHMLLTEIEPYLKCS